MASSSMAMIYTREKIDGCSFVADTTQSRTSSSHSAQNKIFAQRVFFIFTKSALPHYSPENLKIWLSEAVPD
jgi:hypothetical protein